MNSFYVKSLLSMGLGVHLAIYRYMAIYLSKPKLNKALKKKLLTFFYLSRIVT